MAKASADGFDLDGADQEPEPYLGYYFRILQKQGSAAPGGAYDYMIDGHMVAAATNGGCMMLRVDPALTDTYVDGLHVQRFEMRGRGLRGWLDLAPEAVADDEDLRDWLAIGIAHVRSLPPKD